MCLDFSFPPSTLITGTLFTDPIVSNIASSVQLHSPFTHYSINKQRVLPRVSRNAPTPANDNRTQAVERGCMTHCRQEKKKDNQVLDIHQVYTQRCSISTT